MSKAADKFEVIIEDISNGMSSNKACAKNGIPRGTFGDYVANNEDALKRYKAASKGRVKGGWSNPKGSKATDVNDYRRKNASKVNKKRFLISSVYIVNIEDSDFYKIGVSQNMARRHGDLENASPFHINIVKCQQVPDPYDLEEILHSRYSETYLKNDWFTLTKEQSIECQNLINLWQGTKHGFLKSDNMQLILF